MSRRGRPTAAAPTACIDGAAADVEIAVARAAALLAAARRVLVTGLADATLEAVQAACDLAETLGAAIDAGAADAASAVGPIVARAGSITADFEELRDRADLVLVWFCEPEAMQPGFMNGFVTPPLATGSPRRVLAIGPEPLAGSNHLRLSAASAVDAARLVQAILLEHDVPPGNAAAADLADGCRELAMAMTSAKCVGVVTSRAADPLGLAAWAVTLLVQTINHHTPAFVVPLAAPPAGGLGNAAGAAAVLTWRYGAAGGIKRADRDGGEFRPTECSARALIASSEVDAVLAVGRLPPEMEAAIASRAADLAVIRIDDRPDEVPGCAGASVHLRCGPPAGTMLRGDGRELSVGDPETARQQGSMAALVTAIHERLATGAAS